MARFPLSNVLFIPLFWKPHFHQVNIQKSSASKKTEWVNERKISRLVDYLVILEIFFTEKKSLSLNDIRIFGGLSVLFGCVWNSSKPSQLQCLENNLHITHYPLCTQWWGRIQGQWKLLPFFTPHLLSGFVQGWLYSLEGIKQYKCMVILRDVHGFIYNALFGLVLYMMTPVVGFGDIFVYEV